MTLLINGPGVRICINQIISKSIILYIHCLFFLIRRNYNKNLILSGGWSQSRKLNKMCFHYFNP
jgi:hypothetical protein